MSGDRLARTRKWARLCSATVALAVAWAEFKVALDDYRLDSGAAEGDVPPQERKESYRGKE